MGRLWCCVELFVYVQILLEDDIQRTPRIILLGSNEIERQNIVSQWKNFDAVACTCFNESDKKRIFGVISTFPGGIKNFNDHVRNIALNLYDRSRSFHDRSSDSPSRSQSTSTALSLPVKAVDPGKETAQAASA